MAAAVEQECAHKKRAAKKKTDWQMPSWTVTVPEQVALCRLWLALKGADSQVPGTVCEFLKEGSISWRTTFMEFTFATAVASIAAVVLWVGSYSSWNPRRRCDEVLVVHLLPGCVSSRVQ